MTHLKLFMTHLNGLTTHLTCSRLTNDGFHMNGCSEDSMMIVVKGYNHRGFVYGTPEYKISSIVLERR